MFAYLLGFYLAFDRKNVNSSNAFCKINPIEMESPQTSLRVRTYNKKRD